MGLSEFLVILVFSLNLVLGDREILEKKQEEITKFSSSFNRNNHFAMSIGQIPPSGSCHQSLPVPQNVQYNCRNTKCKISCPTNFIFPDGKTELNVDCVSAKWTVLDSDIKDKIPDCTPICEHKCENGGKCIAPNMCNCPRNYKGPQCQYDSQVCNIANTGFIGNYKCSSNSNQVSCSLSCPNGIAMSGPNASAYVCEYSRGQFLPPIPKCNF